MTHNDIVYGIAKNIGNIKEDVWNYVDDNKSLFQTMNRDMKVLLDDEYEDYVTAFTSLSTAERAVFDAKVYWEYDEDEQRLADLEKAEAFLLLYRLALTLKRMSEGDVISNRETFGEGGLVPAPINQVIMLQDHYYQQAVNLIQQKPDRIADGSVVMVI